MLAVLVVRSSAQDVLAPPAPAVDSITVDSSRQAWRIGAVGAGAILVASAAYVAVLSDGWWAGESRGFRFEDPDNDFHYAHNLDKAGHFYAGLWFSEAFRDAYSWAGMGEKASYLAAGLSAGGLHLGMEMKDGLSPEWGFSVWDVAAGTLGGLYPMAQRYLPMPFASIDIKESYWRNSRAYHDSPVEPNGHIWVDDYVNETFWASVKVHRLLPESARPFWPSWLSIALGVGIDEGAFLEPYGGSREVYLSPDWDLEALFRPRSPKAKRFVHYLNLVKMPSPAWKFRPTSEIYWLFPIEVQF